jgi:hypothetical protein
MYQAKRKPNRQVTGHVARQRLTTLRAAYQLIIVDYQLIPSDIIITVGHGREVVLLKTCRRYPTDKK